MAIETALGDLCQGGDVAYRCAEHALRHEEFQSRLLDPISCMQRPRGMLSPESCCEQCVHIMPEEDALAKRQQDSPSFCDAPKLNLVYGAFYPCQRATAPERLAAIPAPQKTGPLALSSPAAKRRSRWPPATQNAGPQSGREPMAPRCAAIVGPYLSGKTRSSGKPALRHRRHPPQGHREGRQHGRRSARRKRGRARCRSKSPPPPPNILGERWCFLDCPGSVELAQERAMR